jgi:hypothetical protein
MQLRRPQAGNRRYNFVVAILGDFGGAERYVKPVAGACLLGLGERSVQVARAATSADSLHNATFAKAHGNIG